MGPSTSCSARTAAPGIAPADPHHFELDPDTLKAKGALPACSRCGEVLRPNILMFGDSGWDASRTDAQETRFEAWLGGLGEARVVIVECGAGTAIPSVRLFCEQRMAHGATLLRINVREGQVPPAGIPLAMGAREALERIEAAAG
jgi:NAD-dependent SIR2 family protein deacetylase